MSGLIKTNPYLYQDKTIKKGDLILLQHSHLALLLDMGLGKSLISLHIAADLQYQTIVIICPKTLINSWKKQIYEHTTLSHYVMVWNSQKAQTQKWQTVFKNWKNSHVKIFMINVESFQAPNKYLKMLIDSLVSLNQKTLLIIDESTKIKTPAAKRTEIILKSFPYTWQRIILTGTPITNSPLDCFAQYEFLKADFFQMHQKTLKQRFWKFKNIYAVMVDDYGAGGRTFKKIVGYRLLSELKSKMDYCTIQLKKEDCLDLPEKIEIEVPIEMSTEMRAFYETFRDKLIAELDDKSLSVTKAIVKFTRLRQICGGFFPDDESCEIIRFEKNNKLDLMLDDIEDTGEKIIIVANYIDEIKMIYSKLNDIYGLSVVTYMGELSHETRGLNLDKFQNDEKTRFLIINPQTGSFGLNLQFARIMYFYSLTPSPEQFWQMKDRIYRIGQKNCCLYKYLMYKHSVDIGGKQILDQKKELANIFTSKEQIKDYLLKERDEL